MTTLADRQQEIHDKVLIRLNENGKILLLMPSGYGQTLIIGTLIRDNYNKIVIASRNLLELREMQYSLQKICPDHKYCTTESEKWINFCHVTNSTKYKMLRGVDEKSLGTPDLSVCLDSFSIVINPIKCNHRLRVGYDSKCRIY